MHILYLITNNNDIKIKLIKFQFSTLPLLNKGSFYDEGIERKIDFRHREPWIVERHVINGNLFSFFFHSHCNL